MCIICIEWEQGKLTSREALRNIGEVAGGPDGDLGDLHYQELANKIMDKEVPFSDLDEDLDRAWHRETHKTREED